MRDVDGCKGPTACVVVPAFNDAYASSGGWQVVALNRQTLPYSTLWFYPTFWRSTFSGTNAR